MIITTMLLLAIFCHAVLTYSPMVFLSLSSRIRNTRAKMCSGAATSRNQKVPKSRLAENEPAIPSVTQWSFGVLS